MPRESDMTDKVTLDHIDYQKIRDRAAAARAEYMSRSATVSIVAVGSTVRAHPIMAIVAILVISFGVKMFVLSAPTAEADTHLGPSTTAAVPSSGMNVLQMQIDHPNRNNLPVQKVDDMSFVFPGP
jgi:hypothetical protein